MGRRDYALNNLGSRHGNSRHLANDCVLRLGNKLGGTETRFDIPEKSFHLRMPGYLPDAGVVR